MRSKSKSDVLLHINDNKLILQQGDVAHVKADAIVCPVNQTLDTTSGVAKEIYAAAGPKIRNQKPLFPEPYGKVVVIPAGRLSCKFVFLTVVLGQTEEDKTKIAIRQAVDRAIRYAEFLSLSSLAFPVMGSSQTPQSYDFIAKEMMENVAFYYQRRRTRVKKMIFRIFNADAYDSFVSQAHKLSFS